MKNGNSRIMKWIWKLQEFEFDIKHIQGKTNHVADALTWNIKLHFTEAMCINELLQYEADKNTSEYEEI